MAVGRLSTNPLHAAGPTFAYMFVFRGSPLLVQLFLIYYGSGQFVRAAARLRRAVGRLLPGGVLLRPVDAGAQYDGLHGGDPAWAVLGVPNGEIEAAKAFGMSRLLQLRRVVFPRAFRIGLPAYTNEIVFLFQATSLVSVITLVDLTGAARDIISDTLRPYPVWIFTGAVYCAISYTLFWFLGRVEWHWSGHIAGQARHGRQGGQTGAARLQARQPWSANRCGTCSCRRSARLPPRWA